MGVARLGNSNVGKRNMHILELGIIVAISTVVVIMASLVGNSAYNTDVADRVVCEGVELIEGDKTDRRIKDCEEIGSWLLEKLYEDAEPTVNLENASALGHEELSITGINQDQCFDISARLFRYANSIEANSLVKSPGQQQFDPRKAWDGCNSRNGKHLASLRLVLN